MAPSKRQEPFSKLDNATLAYFKELRNHFDEVADPDQQANLATSALEETKGKEVAIATDAQCSRILESFLQHATPESVHVFAEAVMAEDSLPSLATSASGSHVSEKLLDTLASSQDDKATKIIQGVAETVAGSLLAFVTDKFACHSARKLLNVAAGCDVAPAIKNTEHFHRSAQKDSAQRGLPAKLGQRQTGSDSSAQARPELLAPISEAILAEGMRGDLAESLPYHQIASPFLQALLLAQKDNREFLEVFIPRLLGCSRKTEDGFFSELSAEDFHAVMQDRTASHVLEVVFGVAPAEMLAEIHDRFLKGNLESLAMHPISNFVVQAELASIRTPQQMKGIAKELRGSFPALLRSKRGGVVSACLAAALRTGAGQVDLAKALSAALRELPGNKQDASNEYVDSLLDLAPKELALVACDASGSRVLESLLESGTAAKHKKKLIKKLQGYFATAALTPAGNFLVEKCYSYGNIKEKEVIAGDLAVHEAALAEQPRGAKLLARCRVADFKRNSKTWRHQVENAAVLRKEFEEFLDDKPPQAPGSPPNYPKTKKLQATDAMLTAEQNSPKDAAVETATGNAENKDQAKKRKKRKAEEIGAVQASEVGVINETPGVQNVTEEPKKKKKKKNKKGEVKAAADNVQQPDTEIPEIAETGASKKRRKLREIEGTEESANTQPVKKAKKQKKQERKDTESPNLKKSEADKPVQEQEASGPKNKTSEQDTMENGQAVGEVEDTQPVTVSSTPAQLAVLASPKKKKVLESVSKDGVMTTLDVFEDRPKTPVVKKKLKVLKRNLPHAKGVKNGKGKKAGVKGGRKGQRT